MGLQGLKEGGNSWNGVVRSDPATAKELDLHPGTTANETGISQLTAADFAALAREGRFCESPLAVRAYLARFMDANPLFRGDGVGPARMSRIYGSMDNKSLTAIDNDQGRSKQAARIDYPCHYINNLCFIEKK